MSGLLVRGHVERPRAGTARRRRLRILITAKKRAWCGELYTIVLGANGLARRGHSVTLAHNPGSSIVRHADRDLLRLVQVDFQRGPLRWHRSWAAMRRLRNTIRHAGIDVVQTHASWDHWMAAAALRGLRQRPPLLRFRHHRKPIVTHTWNRWLYGTATARFLTQTEDVRSDILSTGFVPVTSVTVVGSSVDLERFRPDRAARARVRNELGIPADAKVIGYVGRLSERKRPERLVDAYRLVRAAHPDTWLVVVGWGEKPYGPLMAAAARDDAQLLFPGRKPDPEAYYPAFDAFVLPSYAESFPRAAIEAMACGVVSVTGPDSGLREFVNDGVAGRVLIDDSAASFAAALLDLWRRPGEAAMMAESGRRLVQERLSVEAYVDRLECLLFDVALGV